jgi:hypothetical protein
MNDPFYDNLPVIEFDDPREPRESFKHDCFFLLHWAAGKNWFASLEVRRPDVRIDALQMAETVDDALKLLDEEGVSARNIHKLEELVSLKHFPLIVHNARRSLGTDEQMRLISFLIGIAHDWAKLPQWHLTAVHEVAEPVLAKLHQRPKASRIAGASHAALQ